MGRQRLRAQVRRRLVVGAVCQRKYGASRAGYRFMILN
jgi:hypothetical protein